MDAVRALAAHWDPLETTFYTDALLYSLGSHAAASASGSSSSNIPSSSSSTSPPFPTYLAPFRIAHSPLSGSIALLRNPAVPVPYSGPRSSAAQHKGLGIYSSSAQPIARFTLEDADDGGSTAAASLSARPANWNHPVLLAFDRRGRLVLLEEGGRYRIYATNSSSFTSHSLAPSVLQHPSAAHGPELVVAEAKAYPGGFVARLNSGAHWDVPLDGGRPIPLATAPPVQASSNSNVLQPAKSAVGGEAWCVIGPDEAPLGVTTVYLSRGKTVYTLDRDECIDQRIDKGPFLALLPSSNGRLLALLLPPDSPTANSGAAAFPSLWVVSSTFAESHTTLPPLTLLGLETAPRNQRDEQWKLEDAQWCGNDSVVCAWSYTVLPSNRRAGKAVVCGPGGGFLNYRSSAGEAPVLLPTPGGLATLSPNQLRYIQTVPDELQTLVLAEPEPASAVLLQAHAYFLHGSPKAHGLITALRTGKVEGETLKDGVRSLVDLAKDLTLVSPPPDSSGIASVQKQVLAAAAWGRGFLEEHEREGDEGVVEVGRGLRVLNALREWTVGVPLTWESYEKTDKHLLLSLLTSRSSHLLALRLAAFLDLPPAPILEHWAKALVATTAENGEGDAALVQRIKGKLGKGRGGVYESVAREAWRCGRRGLALSLLELESRMEQGVELLLSMREDRQALDKAVKSGDTDLVYHTLLTLRSKLALGDFFKLVDASPTASALLASYARESESVHLDDATAADTGGGGAKTGGREREMLKDFFWQDDRRKEGALLALEEAALATDATERLACIKLAGKSFSEDRDLGFESKMMDDASKLLTLQQTFEKEADPAAPTPLRLAGLSVNATIGALLRQGLAKKADRVRAEFKVPDRRFYFLKLHALAEIKDWPALEAFAKARRSPIGYEPFVLHLVERGHAREAGRYVARCEAKNRADLYVKCGEWSKAAQECKERNDKARLEQLRNEAPTTLIKREVEAVISSMSR